MIKVLKIETNDEKTLSVYVEDEHCDELFEFYYDATDIPRVTWNKAFERTFFGRFSDAEPLLRNAMKHFRGEGFAMPLQIVGALKQSR